MKNSRRYGLVMCVISLILFFVIAATNQGLREQRLRESEEVVVQDIREALPVFGHVRDFTLTDSFGNPFGLGRMKGKIWVADFVFTSCAGTCPTLTGNLKDLREALGEQPQVEFVSISVDPGTDTPERLTSYAEKNGIDTASWHFLTGSIDDIQTLMVDGFMIGSAEDPLFHSNRFVLVDAAGTIRGFYMGTEEESVDLLLNDLHRLLEE